MTAAVSQSPLARAPRGAAPGSARGPRRSLLVWIAEHAVLVALGVLTIAPIVFVILTSLMSSNQALTASILPRPFDFSNYARVFTELPLAQWFGNSSMYAVLATAFMLVSSVPAAYALAQIKFKGANLVFTIIIVAMLAPIENQLRAAERIGKWQIVLQRQLLVAGQHHSRANRKLIARN